MKKIQYNIGGKGGKSIELKESNNLVAVRTKTDQPLKKSLVSKDAKDLSQKFKVIQKMPRANVTVLEVKQNEGKPLQLRNEARKTFKKETDVKFAGRVLVDAKSDEPVLYTENIYIKFHDDVPQLKCREILSAYELKIKTVLPAEKNGFFAKAPENTGLKIFSMCEELLKKKEIEQCEPEVVRKKGKKNFVLPKKPSIHPRQWHLCESTYRKKFIDAHCWVAKAHKITRGENITIAVIDDGVDIYHPEFKLPGKVHAPYNVDDQTTDPTPFYEDDDHGTACAGVACASGQYKASGVAPAARLMPIRCEADLGSHEEAMAFYYAVDNGADIISCSWGPKDGNPEWKNHKLHFQSYELPEPTRKAIHHAVTKGRNGKGCIVLFSAGNGNENADLDGYIANPDVIAVAASNDRNKRSFYSDYGKCIWVCFPSNDWGFKDHPDPITPGIWTTDRRSFSGYSLNGYTKDFGGTSSACPGVAGVCALILSANPKLTQKQVRKILKDTADKIDNTEGEYNSKGHSDKYGYGRVNALKAVKMAKQM